jgi:hypothetical protein
MLIETLNLINEAIFAGLLLLGVYLLAMNMRTFLLPQKTGRIISLGEMSAEKSCKNCALIPSEPGKSTIPLEIRLENGEICKAEISPCSLCIDRLKIGDPVGVTTFGSRIIAQKIGRVHIKEA